MLGHGHLTHVHLIVRLLKFIFYLMVLKYLICFREKDWRNSWVLRLKIKIKYLQQKNRRVELGHNSNSNTIVSVFELCVLCTPCVWSGQL